MKLLKGVGVALLLLAGFFWIKSNHSSIKNVYPNRCSFLIDEQFSADFKTDLKDFVEQEYQTSKDPKKIIDDVVQKFSHIGMADAYICKTDKLCFSFEAAKPLFVVNDAIILCDNNQVVNKSYYRSDIAQSLSGLQVKQDVEPEILLQFMSMVPQSIFQDFDLTWDDKDQIVCSSKGKTKERLFFSVQRAPSEKDVLFFKDLKSEILKKGVNKRVFDFRFSNQVIIK